MDIQVEEQYTEGLQVVIRCPEKTEQIRRLRAHIALFDSKLQAKADGTTCFVNAGDVLYFESVDDRTFLYTDNAVMEIAYRLYELELMLSERDFLRISKSQIVNIQKTRALHPELNRTLTATLCSGEKLTISRKYVPHLKQLLSLYISGG